MVNRGFLKIITSKQKVFLKMKINFLKNLH